MILPLLNNYLNNYLCMNTSSVDQTFFRCALTLEANKENLDSTFHGISRESVFIYSISVKEGRRAQGQRALG
jgi:hypothetical protein